MAVYVVNLIIDQGTDFEQTFNLSAANGDALNLTNYTASARIRKHSSSKRSYDFTVSFTDRLAGQLKLAMTRDVTKTIKPGRYIYDIFLSDSNSDVTIVVEGQVLVIESATKTVG